MKKIILIFLVVFVIMLVSCDTVDPNDTILVQSPQDSEESTSDQTNTTSAPIEDITGTPSDTSAPITSDPEETDSPDEDTYDKDYSGRY